jgi:hypothetical protein
VSVCEEQQLRRVQLSKLESQTDSELKEQFFPTFVSFFPKIIIFHLCSNYQFVPKNENRIDILIVSYVEDKLKSYSMGSKITTNS